MARPALLPVLDLAARIAGGNQEKTQRASADVSAAESRVELAKALFNQASDRQKNGAGAAVDTLGANVQFQNKQTRLIDSRTAQATSVFGLARLLNVDPRQPIELAVFAEFFRRPTFSTDETIEQALIDAPDELARANDNQIVALYRYNQARADLAHATGQMESLHVK